MTELDWKSIFASRRRVMRVPIYGPNAGRYTQLAEAGKHIGVLEASRILRVYEFPDPAPVAEHEFAEALDELSDGFAGYGDGVDEDAPRASTSPSIRFARPPSWKPSKRIALPKNARICSISPGGERIALANTLRGPCVILSLPSKETLATFEAPWIWPCWDSRSVLAESDAGAAIYGLDGERRAPIPDLRLEHVRLLAPGVWSTAGRDVHLVLAANALAMKVLSGPPTNSHSLRADGRALRLFARKKPWVIPVDLEAGTAEVPAALAKAGLGDPGSGLFHPVVDVVSTYDSPRIDWIGGAAALTLPKGTEALAWSHDGMRLFAWLQDGDQRYLDVWA